MVTRIKDMLDLYSEAKDKILIELNKVEDQELYIEVEENIIEKIDFHIDLLEQVIEGNIINEEDIIKSYNLAEIYYNLVVNKILIEFQS